MLGCSIRGCDAFGGGLPDVFAAGNGSGGTIVAPAGCFGTGVVGGQGHLSLSCLQPESLINCLLLQMYLKDNMDVMISSLSTTTMS
ncbi:hypothetical protein L1987_27488 [Smallanthus sonchifolius]|uniref:Uncharacterized protein n=1 Tax=Smallanthus sonchifolius TaxID=185202 RepID=A0ACB9IAN1_9ASTR|nr:hypothetical protein L1987_27488 [Smallanthus sonchifolius]